MRSRALPTTLIGALLVAGAAGCKSNDSSKDTAGVVPGPTSSTSASAAPTPTSAATPTAAALPYLNGAYRVVVVVKTSNTDKQSAGTRVTRTWKFSGGCPASCAVSLLREASWYNPNGTRTTKYFSSTASRTSTGYHGVEHRPQQCPISPSRAITGPEQSTLDYTIQLITHNGARPSFKGTATNTAPAQGGCDPVTQTFVFTGTPI